MDAIESRFLRVDEALQIVDVRACVQEPLPPEIVCTSEMETRFGRLQCLAETALELRISAREILTCRGLLARLPLTH